MLHRLQSDLPSIAGLDLKLRLEFRPSVLFRRSYLVGWTSARALKALAPDCDAIAVSLSLLLGEDVPVVLAPKPRDLSDAFRSVLEHEFVHVNQMLTGITPPDYRVTCARGIVDAFFAHVKIEHDAYLVQSVRWPKVAPPRHGLSFNEWCLLRSHTQAVERALEDIQSETVLRALLNGVPKDAADRLGRLGYDEQDVAWFRARWARHIVIAAQMIVGRRQDAIPARNALVRWLHRKDIAVQLRVTKAGATSDTQKGS